MGEDDPGFTGHSTPATRTNDGLCLEKKKRWRGKGREGWRDGESDSDGGRDRGREDKQFLKNDTKIVFWSLHT